LHFKFEFQSAYYNYRIYQFSNQPLNPMTHQTNNQSNQANLCEQCGKKSVTINRCTGCKDTYYCSTDCQRKGWKIHRELCDSYMTASRCVERINETLENPTFLNAMYTLMNRHIVHYIDEHLVCQIFKTETGYQYEFEHRYTRKSPDKDLQPGLNVVLLYVIRQRATTTRMFKCVHTINRMAGREETEIATNIYGKDAPIFKVKMPCSLIVYNDQVYLRQDDINGENVSDLTQLVPKTDDRLSNVAICEYMTSSYLYADLSKNQKTPDINESPNEDLNINPNISSTINTGAAPAIIYATAH